VSRYVIGFVILVFGLRTVCGSDPPPPPGPLRIATFNIEDFPKDDRQIAGAFDELGALDAGIIAVQEIMDPRRFERELKQRLGADRQVVFEPFVERGYRHTGVVFDRRAFSFVSTRLHEETRLRSTHKAVLEVRLRPLAGGDVIRVLVVHLKAGSDGRDVRERQHAVLAGVVRRAVDSGDRVVVLGDFNATHDELDRADLAALAKHADLVWTTEPLACSAFWRRDDGCPSSRLDHIVAWKDGKVSAAGACAADGCEWKASCPVYASQISDHCPVVLQLD
jgi:endonuclease/exonuclease/phosphatase family metal-dependent hydrolase